MSDQYVAYFLGGSLDLTKRVVEKPLMYMDVAVLDKLGFKDDSRERLLEVKRETYVLRFTNTESPPWRPRELVYVLIER